MVQATTFKTYISQFGKEADTAKSQTHLSFNKGKYNVPDAEYDNFYKEYFGALKRGEPLYLIEKVTDSKFAFFLDLDGTDLTDTIVKEITGECSRVLSTMYPSGQSTQYVVSKRESKYHVNYPDIIVDCSRARMICEKLMSNYSTECIDMSVYRTGLRLLGSRKAKCNGIYAMYDLDTGEFTTTANLDWATFAKTIVRQKNTKPLTQMREEWEAKAKHSVVSKTIPVKGISDNGVTEEIKTLLEELKEAHDVFSNVDMTIHRVYGTKNKSGMFCYYISIADKYCPFKARDHKRDSSPIYIEIGMNGIALKCYDQDCLRRKFPDPSGLPLLANFETRFPKMWMSMATRYWSTEINMTDDIKKHLEDSLCGSHYQIAKTAFHIFKDRFRVDDVRNTTWFEYDGTRWKKSHLMNILISEELPKYYRGIKISDTGAANGTGLAEYLTNSDNIDNNMRNSLVDNIITKLENYTFKGNILQQISYLFKTHDPDFYQNLDSDPKLVGFNNGVYDFNTNCFRQSKQSDYLTFSTGYEYTDYNENAPEVMQIYEFLSKIIPNERVRNYLLKVLGKSLVGIPEEKFYIWTGLSGANGKSTLVNFLEATLGDYITSVDVSLLTNKRANSGNASPDIVRLRGKRLFTFQEPEHNDKLRTGILKQYTGGDTIIARELFKAPITFKLQGTMLMCCNDLPSISSIDGGTWRRIRVIEFNSRFCDNPVKSNEYKIDPDLKTKIVAWRPYFMSILIHWYNKYLQEGLREPEEVKKATANYKNDNDKFNEFFDECLEENNSDNNNDILSTKVIYHDSFRFWWDTNYPNTKAPEMKELRRAMKIKYGNERESSTTKERGFSVRVLNKFEDMD